MKRISHEKLGKPDLQFACLSIWIYGRENEDSTDFWDGNWLRVLVHVGSSASDVWASGSILHLSELSSWLGGLRKLHDELAGTAELSCVEPNLGAKVTLDALGRGTLIVQITADHLSEQHTFTTHIDQSYLPDVIRSLQQILEQYPLRGESSAR